MNYICLDESLFPEKAYDIDEYLSNLPQGKIDRIKRRIRIFLTELDIF
jgi:hypothetical protein